jgi:hypothetical protein
MLEEQVAKRAAASEAAATTKMQGVATTVATAGPELAPPAAAPKKFDVGTIAALGVGVGALTTAFGIIFGNVLQLPAWQLPLVIVGVLLVISLPSMAVAALKIRQRTVAPLLEANGWAINGRVKVNIPFGTALTEKAALPANARRTLTDPYEDRTAARRRQAYLTIIFLGVVMLILAYRLHTWPFNLAGNADKPGAAAPAAAGK